MSKNSSLPLLLVPGLACTGLLFAHQIKQISKDREILAADISGHETISALAAAILEAAPERFALAGLSMGGYLSFELWRQAPDRIARLALMDTTARGDTDEKTVLRHEAIELAKAGKFEAVSRAGLEFLIARGRQDDKALRDDIMKMAMDTGAENWIGQVKAIMSRPDSVGLLAEITCPTLVVVGEDDQLTPVDQAREMADGIDGAKLEIIAGSGHMTTMERPEQVTQLLQNWLKNV